MGVGGSGSLSPSPRSAAESSAAASLPPSLPSPPASPPLLLGVGGAAEGLVHRLHDGVAVDAEDAQQLVGLAAAGHLGDGQALHGEARLVDHRRAHRLAETTWWGEGGRTAGVG